MPRFFLNILKNGELIEDPEGDDVPDLHAIRQIAIETLRDLRRLPHVYGEPHLWEEREFVITNETGQVLMVIPFTSSTA
jgi:hypothetical protein